MSQKTHTPSQNDFQRRWVIFDAEDVALGRLATRVARVLRGKHKRNFTPHLDCGDGAIVVNASKIRLTGDKSISKKLRRHSQFPGGLREDSYQELLDTNPGFAIRRTVQGMLPKNRLGRKILKHLRVYRGSDHDHEAQQPIEYDWENDRVPAPNQTASS